VSEDVEYFVNDSPFAARPTAAVDAFTDTEAAAVRGFQATLPGYAPTPLCSLPALAARLGLGDLFVKDESRRFGLNAFKVLGASYAVGRVVAARLGLPISSLPFARLIAEDSRQRLRDLVLTTTTDGNHGRAVAWMARQLGLRCVVHMPKGSAAARLQNIRAEGAAADILDMNYDEAVAFSAEEADRQGWVLVQDTAWEGYEEIPRWIMQGYATIVEESLQQMAGGPPTHVFVQAGVGALAGGVLGRLTARFGAERPRVVVAEARAADCLHRSARSGAGAPVTVTGDLATIMAGLACGQPSALAWPILRDYASAFVACADPVAARGMRVLGNPLRGDPQVISGESGAITLGLLTRLMEDPKLAPVRTALGLGADSRVLLFSTEGDTDPVRYREIVWDGAFPSLLRPRADGAVAEDTD
jgi:diaminopropionate ammonia-lyase